MITCYVVAPRIGYPIKGIFFLRSIAFDFAERYPKSCVFEVEYSQLYYGSRLSGENVIKCPDDIKYILK